MINNKINASYIISLFTLFLVVAPPYAYASLDRAKEVGFIAHKALYNIELSAKKSSAHISNISGKMFYEWKSSCDAWVTNNRFDMLYEYPQTPAVRMTSNLSTYESFDGSDFNFTVQRMQGGVIFEEIRGSANINEANYSMPKDLVFELPKGTLFPVSHTLAVLDNIKKGNKFYKATIFDGSDTGGPIDINSFIMSKASDYIIEPSREGYIDKALLNSKGWDIRLAFFPLSNFETISDYEMSVTFHENGVISSMDVDYGDFSVTHKLIALEPLDDDCLDDINNR